MKNEVQPYLGYTPLNKAGDTWTGDLIGGNLYADRYLGIIGDINQAKWFMHTSYYSMIFYSDHNDSSYIPEADPTINRFGRTYRPKAALRPEGHFDIAGEYRGRYDHQNRFVVSAFAGQDITITAYNFIVLGRISIVVPSGKGLHVRRVRAYFEGGLRVRVYTNLVPGNSWIAGQARVDQDVNVHLCTGPVFGTALIAVNNVSNSSQTLPQGRGAIAELEIR